MEALLEQAASRCPACCMPETGGCNSRSSKTLGPQLQAPPAAAMTLAAGCSTAPRQPSLRHPCLGTLAGACALHF